MTVGINNLVMEALGVYIYMAFFLLSSDLGN